MTDRDIALRAWEVRRLRYQDREPVDNTALPAGSPIFLTCQSCFGHIILIEDYLLPPRLCYDCRYLFDHDWIAERDGGWERRR